ncbi:hypothetical protein [Ferrimicrobium acidiphilum]|uniref:hypothetical protein n=1 Tax=Ferrimicrobium acidiphilum TaxID=121039 RepID=UPI0023F21510
MKLKAFVRGGALAVLCATLVGLDPLVMSSETSLASSSTTGPSGTISQTISPDGIYPGTGGRYLYGSDTNGPTPTYSSSEGYYYEGNGPSSIYGFYAGEMGVFQQMDGCPTGGVNYYSLGDANAASYDSTRILAMGASEYYFMAGPGISNSAGGDAAWGTAQANWVLGHLVGPNDNNIIWIDIEHTGGYSNGWHSNGNSCGNTQGGTILYGPAQDRATFNAFYNTIAAAGYTVGVYSNPGAWQTDFGTGSYGSIPNTLEWTSESSFAANPAPTLGSWCGSGGCAEFFGGQSAGGQSAGGAHAVAWQWSEEGGDFDITYWGSPQ